MSALPEDYDAVLAQIRQLDSAARRRLLIELSELVRQENAAQPARSIRELRGLGKEIWEGIDAQEYVRRERAAWTR